MRPTFKFALVLLLFCFLCSTRAHTDLHERIVELTEKLAKDPQSAELLFQRGLLFEQHEEFERSVRDLTAVERLAPETQGLHFAKARSYFGLQHYPNALNELNRIGATESESDRVLIWRGRVLSKLGRGNEAKLSYRAAFEKIEKPSPDLYVEFARLISIDGTEHYSEAINGLDHAIEKMGPVITLHLEALGLEAKLGDYDAASRRLDRLLEIYPDMPTLLKRKGVLLLKLDRADDARQTFEAALRSLETLPPARRNTDTNQELEKEIRARLEE